MARRILVLGLGRFGAALARSLTDAGCEVIAADRDMRQVDAIKDRVAYAIELDATSPEALRSIDAGSCLRAIVAIGESFESAVLSVAALREIGMTRILARATTPAHARIMQAAGADQVIEIESEMGRSLGQRLAHDDLATQAATQAGAQAVSSDRSKRPVAP